MIITDIEQFESVCKQEFLDWLESTQNIRLTLEDIDVIWASKTSNEYKSMLSININDSCIYAECIYDDDGLNVFIYGRIDKMCYREE